MNSGDGGEDNQWPHPRVQTSPGDALCVGLHETSLLAQIENLFAFSTNTIPLWLIELQKLSTFQAWQQQPWAGRRGRAGKVPGFSGSTEGGLAAPPDVDLEAVVQEEDKPRKARKRGGDKRFAFSTGVVAVRRGFQAAGESSARSSLMLKVGLSKPVPPQGFPPDRGPPGA